MIQSKHGFRWMDLQINTYEVRILSYWETDTFSGVNVKVDLSTMTEMLTMIITIWADF